MKDEAYGLRKYPSNLIRITPAKGFEAHSKSFATPFLRCKVLKKLLPLLALVAMPALAKPVLTVYTYDSFSADWGPGPAVKSL